METNYIRFDWAVKKLLRQKANFAVLEGFLTVLLREKIKIISILESESNQESEDDKFNRVDMLAQNDKGALIIIEVQNARQVAYYHRILYGASKAIVERIKLGDDYAHVKKVYAISILYFVLGYGKDYVYHGKTEFRGLHHPEEVLHLSERQKLQFQRERVGDIFPEYYIIRVDDFDQASTDPLDEWISFLKTSSIPDSATAPGLEEARKVMALNNMSSIERAAYERHLDNLRHQRSIMETQRMEGKDEGLEEGLAKGRAEGRIEGRTEGLAEGREEGKAEGRVEGKAEGRVEEKIEIAKNAKKLGLSIAQIQELTNLSTDEIERLL